MSPVWLFDCDNTLYSPHNGFFLRVDAKIREYMATRLKIDGSLIEPLRDRYREEFGITLSGLMRDYAVDPDDYLAFVHDVPLDDLILPDERLGNAFDELDGPKYIFTNGTAAHATRVLKRLGVAERIERIFDIAFMDYRPKPGAYGYAKVVGAIGADCSDCVMVDDSQANLETARKFGMRTVLVGGKPLEGHLHAVEAWALPSLGLSWR